MTRLDIVIGAALVEMPEVDILDLQLRSSLRNDGTRASRDDRRTESLVLALTDPEAVTHVERLHEFA